MVPENWVKIHRSMLDFEWYDEPNTIRLLLHLILKANYQAGKYRGTKYNKGDVLTGYDKLATELNMSVQNVRTSLKKLEDSKEITRKSTRKGSVITLVKWGQMQLKDNNINKQSNKHLTDTQQTPNKHLTTNKNLKNERMKEISVCKSDEYACHLLNTEKDLNCIECMQKKRCNLPIKDSVIKVFGTELKAMKEILK